MMLTDRFLIRMSARDTRSTVNGPPSYAFSQNARSACRPATARVLFHLTDPADQFIALDQDSSILIC